MKDSFSQKDAAGYLAKCESQDQVQDVLTAYVSTLTGTQGGTFAADKARSGHPAGVRQVRSGRNHSQSDAQDRNLDHLPQSEVRKSSIVDLDA